MKRNIILARGCCGIYRKKEREGNFIMQSVSCARGPGFDPPPASRKICWSELASLRVICRNDMIQCAVLLIGTLTGGPLCRDSHTLCRLKIPTQVKDPYTCICACRLILQNTPECTMSMYTSQE